MNPNKSFKLGLISQIHITLNLRYELNQEVQFNVEGWNHKKISILKTCQSKKSQNKKNKVKICH